MRTFDIESKIEVLKAGILIKHLAHKVFSKRLSAVQYLNQYKRLKIKESLKNQLISKFLREEVLKTLFFDNYNAELNRQINPFFEFLSPGVGFGELLLIVESAQSKSKEERQTLQHNLNVLGKKLDQKVIIQLIEHSQVNVEKVSDFYLDFLSRLLTKDQDDSLLNRLVS